MATLTLATALTAASTAVGAGTALYGAQQQRKGQKQVAQAQAQQNQISKQAEAARQKQQRLEAQRQRRNLIRQSILQRAQSVNSLSTRGGVTYGSSAFGGIDAQTGQQLGAGLTSVNQSERIGNELFDLNAQLADARYAQSQGQALSAEGQGIQNIGFSLLRNNEKIGRIGATVLG